MLGRALPLAALLVVTGLAPAAAQMPPGMGGAPMGQPGMGGAPMGQEPPCMKDFMPLRAEAEKRAMAVRAAHDKQATPQEACKLIGLFADAEGKLVKFVEANGSWCGIPDQVAKQMKGNHEHTLQLRKQICTVAANPPRPAGPSLSDALDPSATAAAPASRTGRGTFDTLTGSAIGR